MSLAWIAFSGTALAVVLAGGLSIGLYRAVTANDRLARENNRLSNQLDTYRLWLGDPARLMSAHPDLFDSPEEDELR